MKITTYRVPQLMSKMLTVICVNDRPICAVRGKKSTCDVLAKIFDDRIQKIVDEEVEKATVRLGKDKRYR